MCLQVHQRTCRCKQLLLSGGLFLNFIHSDIPVSTTAMFKYYAFHAYDLYGTSLHALMHTPPHQN